MKLTVKTLKGSHFEIRVLPSDTVMAVKKNIEAVQGKDNYPCGQQLLIHNGKVLKDETTLAENKVTEDGFLVVMLSKSKSMGAPGTSSAQSASSAAPAPAPSPAPAHIPAFIPASCPTVAVEAPVNAQATRVVSTSEVSTDNVPADTYGQAASNIVSANNLEQTIQQIMDIGGGSWDKETVTRALRAAYNNPERAVDYLYSGIPEATEVVAVPVGHFPANQATGGINYTAAAVAGSAADPVAPTSAVPNSSPLNMFPQETLSGAATGGLGSLEFLRNNHQFQALRAMVQANPQILQPMLQELGKQNPHLLRLIQEHHAEFLQLINEPLEGSGGSSMKHAEVVIARRAVEEGRGLVVIVNKMDLLRGRNNSKLYEKVMEAVPEEIQRVIPQVTGIPVVFISALEGRGRIAVMRQIIDTYEKWCSRLSTARLNRWLCKVMSRHSWKDQAAQPKVKYFTQVKARPPTFVAFMGGKTQLSNTDIRFLTKSLKEDFDLGGIPIRIMQRSVPNRVVSNANSKLKTGGRCSPRMSSDKRSVSIAENPVEVLN